MNNSELQEIYNQYGSVTDESALYKSNQTKNITLDDWNTFVKLLQTRSEDVKRLYKSLIPEVDSELSLCLRKKQTSFELEYVDNDGISIAKLSFPTISDTVATESYVNTSLTEGLNTKVDKIIGGGLKVYANNDSGYMSVSNEPTDGYIPIYNGNKRIKTSSPEDATDAANKGYVDDNFVKKDSNDNVTIAGNLTVSGEITFVDTDQITSDNPVAVVNSGYLDTDAAAYPSWAVTGIVAITDSKDDTDRYPAFGFLYHRDYGPVLVKGHYSDNGIFSVDGNYSENIAVKRGEVTSGMFTYFDENNILRSSETSVADLAEISKAVDRICEIQNEYIGNYRR